AGEGADFGGDVKDDQAVRVDVRNHIEQDADVIILNGVDRLSFIGELGPRDEGDFLTDGDAGELIVGCEDVWAGQDVELALGFEGAEGRGEVLFEDGNDQPGRLAGEAEVGPADRA